MKKIYSSKSLKHIGALLFVVYLCTQSLCAKGAGEYYRHEPIGYRVVKVPHDWANPDHYLSADEIVGWANDPSDPFPYVEPWESRPRYGGEFTLRTNLAYWLGGMMNVGVEWRSVDDPYGIVINGGYSALGNDRWQRCFGGWFVSPELRRYLGCRGQWFIGGQFLYGGFNILRSPSYFGRKGHVLGGGVTGGYRLYLSPIFDMDFSLGIGYAKFDYDTYIYSESDHIGIGWGFCEHRILPLQVGVNLIWKLER